MGEEICPDRQLLTRYLLGRVEGDTANELDEHISTCDSCLDQMRELCAEDKLTHAIVAKNSGGWPEQSQHEIESISDRLKRMPNPNSTSESNSDVADKDHEQIASGYILAPPQEPDEIGRLDRYRVLQLIGVGGMGLVFRAHDPLLDRIVALKTIKLLYMESSSKRERFMREAQAAAAIESDHVVTVYEVGEDRDMPFLTMQFLRGQTLRHRMLDKKRLGIPEVLRIGREVAVGLSAAHKEGLLHRDIKPDNIWIEEETDRAKVLDFGLSRAIGDSTSLTHSGIVGTPKYMSPEQAQGENVDPTSDLFSLGCVLYHLLAGDPPFSGKSTTDTLIAIVQDAPRPLEEIKPDIPAHVCRLVMRLLEKEPSARFQSANDVIDAIDQIDHSVQCDPREDSRTNEDTQPFKPVRPTKPTPPAQHRTSRRFQIALGALAMICLGVLIHLATDRGTLVVQAEDSVKVMLKNNQVKVSGIGNKRTYTIRPGAMNIKPGSYKIDVTDNTGLKFSTEKFSVSRLGKQIVSVRMQRNQDGEHAPDTDNKRKFNVGYGRLEHLLLGHTGQVYKIAFSPDGRRAISGGFDKFAILWDLDSGREIRRFDGHLTGIDAVAYSSDGIHLATGSHDRTVRVWDKDKLDEVHQLICKDAVRTVAFSPMGRMLLVTHRSTAMLLDVKTMAVIWEQDTGKHNRSSYIILCSAFSPDGKVVAIGNTGGQVIVLNTSKGERGQLIEVDESRPSVITVAFSSDNRHINTVAGRRIQQWNAETGAVSRRAITLDLSRPVPRTVAFSPSGQSALVVYGGEPTVRLYNLKTGEERHQIVQASTPFHGLAYSPDGANALLGNFNATIQYFKFPKPD